jgi:ABC-type uncharacterized transport system ATPase component
MAEPLSEEILQKIEPAAQLYHRLVLVVGPAGAGKTAALRDLRDRTGAPLLNVNLELSLRMLELTERQRALQAGKLFAAMVARTASKAILLDNLEMLFDVHLKQDPLRLLQGSSRNKTIVAAWNGRVLNGQLTYAAPEHPEYRRYPIRDLLIVSAEAAK